MTGNELEFRKGFLKYKVLNSPGGSINQIVNKNENECELYPQHAASPNRAFERR